MDVNQRESNRDPHDDLPDYVPKRSWPLKFARAIRGVFVGMATQSSFAVHVPVSIAVMAMAAWLELDRSSWSLLLLCIGGVMSTELLNTSIEILSRQIDRKENRDLGNALDIAGGAVLTISIAAVVVGLLILGPPLWAKLFATGS
jgi:diacylglycerol kinase